MTAAADAYPAGRTKPTRAPRTRATRAEMEHRREVIHDIVRENQPTSIRFTYYTATTLGLVTKDDSGAEKVQRAVLAMRRSERMPWEWIVDTNRWMRKPDSYDSVEEALAELGESYRKDMWRRAGTAVEVWCESESVAGVLFPVTAEWDVPLYPIKGQTSDTFAHSTAQEYRRDRRALQIIYVGDHDPHGYEIETNLHHKLVKYSGRSDVSFHRLACNAEHVADLGLSGGPAKKTTYVDAATRAKVAWFGPAVEVEAIPPGTLRGWLSDAIEAFVDPEALRLHRIAEESERAGLLALAGRGLIGGGGA